MDTKALSNIEVMTKPSALSVAGVQDGETIVVLTSDSNHALDDGDTVELDDMNGKLVPLAGRRFAVKRMAVAVFDPKREFSTADPMLKNATAYCGATLQKMLDTHLQV